MRVVQVEKPNAPLELVERPIPEPGPREARIKVEACGICYSDSFAVTGTFPGVRYPAVPGHEIAGRIDAVGSEVTDWRVGQRVGVGWFGGVLRTCARCRRGDFITCRNAQNSRHHFDGGYAEYMIAPIEALAAIPDELDAVDAAPLLCAGITTFNALRNAARAPATSSPFWASAGSAISACSSRPSMGFEPWRSRAARTRRSSRASSARMLYIDSEAEDPAAALLALGGAKVILATVTERQGDDAANRRTRRRRQADRGRRVGRADRGQSRSS